MNMNDREMLNNRKFLDIVQDNMKKELAPVVRNHDKIRSFTSAMLKLAVVLCAISFLVVMFTEEITFFVCSCLVLFSTYVMRLFANAYADLVENSYKNLANQERIIALLSQKQERQSETTQGSQTNETNENSNANPTPPPAVSAKSPEDSGGRRRSRRGGEQTSVDLNHKAETADTDETEIFAPAAPKPTQVNPSKPKLSSKPADWWTCKKCGEDNYTEFSSCVHCGSKKA